MTKYNVCAFVISFFKVDIFKCFHVVYFYATKIQQKNEIASFILLMFCYCFVNDFILLNIRQIKTPDHYGPGAKTTNYEKQLGKYTQLFLICQELFIFRITP